MKRHSALGVRRSGIALFVVLIVSAVVSAQQNDAPVRILLDQTPRAIEYQLSRLTNDELSRVERKADDPKYRLVYVALLTRPGLAKSLREEAVAALGKIDGRSRTRVLLDALSRMTADDDATADVLAGMVLAQPIDALSAERDTFSKLIAGDEVSPALRAAYGTWMTLEQWPAETWLNPDRRPGHTIELLKSVPLVPLADNLGQLRNRLAVTISSVIASPGANAEFQTAALRSLLRVPDAWWPATEIAPFANLMVVLAGNTPAAARADSPATEAIQLGERLARLAPAPQASRIRQQLRALGVQIVRIETVPEQMAFTVKWFVVERGKPVQVVLFNPDAAPHNLVIGKPGALEKIGTAAMTMALPSDPATKPYVPGGPLVVQATNLVKEGETERLRFTAPAEPGEYVYLCSFPGHWVRMYGVMLVVDSLDAWEASPTTPADPMTNRPFTSR